MQEARCERNTPKPGDTDPVAADTRRLSLQALNQAIASTKNRWSDSSLKTNGSQYVGTINNQLLSEHLIDSTLWCFGDCLRQCTSGTHDRFVQNELIHTRA